MVKTLLTKVSENGVYHYRLVQFADNKYLVSRLSKKQSTPAEADFAETIGEFSNEKAAKDFFENVGR